MTEYHHYKISCRTLSPLHIGNGEQLASIGDYYVSSNRIFFIDKSKLDQCLNPVDNKLFFDNYMNEIKKNVTLSKSDFSIVPFLEQHGITLDEIALKNEIPICTTDYKSHKNSQLKSSTRQNGFNYVPGSSIKGAIKTALFYSYLRDNPTYLSEWTTLILNSTSRKNYLSVWKNTIEKRFNQFPANNQSDYNFLRVEDSPMIDNRFDGIWETSRLHLYKDNDSLITWLSEGIISGTSFDIAVTIIPEFKFSFLHFLNGTDIDALFTKINRFSCDQIRFEINEIKGSRIARESKQIIIQQLNDLLTFTKIKRKAIIRIGAGKSFFYNTICSLLDKAKMEKLRSLVGIGKKDETIFPLSRTFTTDYECFGWILLELPIEEEKEPPVNRISELIVGRTHLQAVIIDQKKVRININDVLLEVQLFLSMEQKCWALKTGDIIEVFVKQTSKDNRIVMVGINSNEN